MKVMKVILIITFTCLSLSLLAQTKEDSIRWKKLAEQRISVGKDSVYKQLLRAKRPENYLNPPSLSYSSAPYYTEASKQLLLEVLKDDWITETQKREEAEKKVWQEVNKQISTYEEFITDTLKYRVFKRKQKKFQIVLDSLKGLKQLNVDTVFTFQAELNRFVLLMDQRKMPDLYIYTAGMLDSTLYVAMLKKALEDTIKYDPDVVKMALGRNKVEPYVTDALKNNQINIKNFEKEEDQIYIANKRIFPTLAYLSSDAAIYEYSKLLIIEHFECIDYDDYEKCSIPHYVVENLYVLILNEEFRNYLKGFMVGAVPNPKKLSKRDIKWVQNWLEENYGNYKLDENFYPGLR